MERPRKLKIIKSALDNLVEIETKKNKKSKKRRNLMTSTNIQAARDDTKFLKKTYVPKLILTTQELGKSMNSARRTKRDCLSS